MNEITLLVEKRLERYEKAISILRWCTNVLEELKNETSEEEYDFIKEVLDL